MMTEQQLSPWLDGRYWALKQAALLLNGIEPNARNVHEVSTTKNLSTTSADKTILIYGELKFAHNKGHITSVSNREVPSEGFKKAVDWFRVNDIMAYAIKNGLCESDLLLETWEGRGTAKDPKLKSFIIDFIKHSKTLQWQKDNKNGKQPFHALHVAMAMQGGKKS